MKSLKVPVSIQRQIAVEIADPKQIYQKEIPHSNLRPNQWNRLESCLLNCGNTKGTTSIHTGTGAFFTKCCGKKGGDVVDFIMEKDIVSTQEAVDKISMIMGKPVRRLPKTIRGMFPLTSSKALTTEDGELVMLVGIYDSSIRLVFQTDADVIDDTLRVYHTNFIESELVSEDKFLKYDTSDYLFELIENASTNGLVKSGAVINLNGSIFIDEDKFQEWFSTLAKCGGNYA